MNWPTLLSEYPQSLLRDESCSLLLAALEIQGLSTEEELQKLLVGIDHITLTKSLLQLNLNHMVEITSSYIKIADKGRLLLDRLEVSAMLITHNIYGLGLSQLDQQNILALISDYRAAAFPLYLNTVAT